jgi:hypothetical protein
MVNLGDVLRKTRLNEGETQLSLAMKIRERFRNTPGRKTAEVTICRVECSGRVSELTWSRIRSILPTLPEWTARL